MNLDYFAGFVDGEGCFSVCKYKKRNNYRFQVSVVNTNFNVIKEIQKEFGGKITSSLTPSRKKILFRLWWQGKEAIKIATILKDKLIVKKEQATIISELIIYEKTKNFPSKTSPEDLIKRENARQKISEANA